MNEENSCGLPEKERLVLIEEYTDMIKERRNALYDLSE